MYLIIYVGPGFTVHVRHAGLACHAIYTIHTDHARYASHEIIKVI